MRVLQIIVLCIAAVSADTVVRNDGRIMSGRVVAVEIETANGVVRLRRDSIAAVHLDLDRELADLRSLNRMLLFARQRGPRPIAIVGVFCGRGAFAPSALAVVRRLEEKSLPTRLLFEVTDDTLKGLRGVIVPGGWAPSQLDAMGKEGQIALRRFVRSGGRYLGICAGAYAPCTTVRWEGIDYPRPLGMVRGIAVGPVSGLVAWPGSQAVTLTLADGTTRSTVYAGGAFFSVAGASVLARYDDARAATIVVRLGNGLAILTGVHPEFDARKDADLLDWAPGVEAGDGSYFHELARLLLRRS